MKITTTLILFLISLNSLAQSRGQFIRNDTMYFVRGVGDTIAMSSMSQVQTALSTKQSTITVLSFANGGISGAAATSATTGTFTVNMTSSVITITPTGNCTFNASGGVAGQRVTFSITTSGISSFTLTWGTNFRKTGTLATGTTSARFFTVTFICIDGTVWSEISRTAVQS